MHRSILTNKLQPLRGRMHHLTRLPTELRQEPASLHGGPQVMLLVLAHSQSSTSAQTLQCSRDRTMSPTPTSQVTSSAVLPLLLAGRLVVCLEEHSKLGLGAHLSAPLPMVSPTNKMDVVLVVPCSVVSLIWVSLAILCSLHPPTAPETALFLPKRRGAMHPIRSFSNAYLCTAKTGLLRSARLSLTHCCLDGRPNAEQSYRNSVSMITPKDNWRWHRRSSVRSLLYVVVGQAISTLASSSSARTGLLWFSSPP